MKWPFVSRKELDHFIAQYNKNQASLRKLAEVVDHIGKTVEALQGRIWLLAQGGNYDFIQRHYPILKFHDTPKVDQAPTTNPKHE